MNLRPLKIAFSNAFLVDALKNISEQLELERVPGQMEFPYPCPWGAAVRFAWEARKWQASQTRKRADGAWGPKRC